MSKSRMFRDFDGKQYIWHSGFHSKVEAKAFAKKIRKEGFYARVIPIKPKGRKKIHYLIYSRRK